MRFFLLKARTAASAAQFALDQFHTVIELEQRGVVALTGRNTGANPDTGPDICLKLKGRAIGKADLLTNVITFELSGFGFHT